MDDFYEWLERKGKWAEWICRIIVTFCVALLFGYLILVC